MCSAASRAEEARTPTSRLDLWTGRLRRLIQRLMMFAPSHPPVLTVVSKADDMNIARSKAYQNVGNIRFKDASYRNDIALNI